jgi:2-dehydropantoate 2-reductase
MKSRLNLAKYRIAVVGSGAVGGYYGAMLAAAGCDVHFLMRRELEVVKDRGLRVRSGQGDFHLETVNAYGSSEAIGPVDLVIIALKTTANEVLLELIPPLLKEGTMLLTLQNGLGADELLAEQFGGERVMGGLCFVCLNRTEPGVIDHIGEGRIHLGEYSGEALPRTHEVAGAFNEAGVDCVVTDRLAGARWKKLVWNVPFNGLSIIGGGIDVGQILADEELLGLTRELMGEVVGAAGKLGYALRESLVEDQIEVTRRMGAYRPSSLIDYLEGREVEVESIWGEPWRRGVNAGAEVGRMEMVYRQIQRALRERGEREGLP